MLDGLERLWAVVFLVAKKKKNWAATEKPKPKRGSTMSLNYLEITNLLLTRPPEGSVVALFSYSITIITLLIITVSCYVSLIWFILRMEFKLTCLVVLCCPPMASLGNVSAEEGG